MLRYLRTLSGRDVALDRSMIPLGSCTMKLNATTEMQAVSWPEFSTIHPFAPLDQADGYVTLIDDLERWLCAITGYDAVSLQPNAGSQGEFAGLLAIRAYHRDRGEEERDVCLIPSSAHGTNAASAVMAGMRVVVVACDELGNVDLDDLRVKLAEHGEHVAALMITYPSTHGVYEQAVGEICGLVHDAGGQVYVDGANLNALVGLAQPGQFGADVSHLNLHKTFCIPHGGGGPGVGPVAVRAHLRRFLPNHPLQPAAGPASGPGPVSAAPWGSASILPISWAYIRLMGPDGLRQATQVAILNANYIARRLNEHFPVLYTGQGGLVAHECILDLRPITKDTGVTVEDVAKRLIDYGLHAPTMSFPVAGTLMVEPTESEDLGEIERFIDAMIHIRAEIDRVAAGEWPADDNPLVNAPHTAEMLTRDWTHPYTRDDACYPAAEPAAHEVLVARAPHRGRLRRPQPRRDLPARHGVRDRRGLVPAAREPPTTNATLETRSQGRIRIVRRETVARRVLSRTVTMNCAFVRPLARPARMTMLAVLLRAVRANAYVERPLTIRRAANRQGPIAAGGHSTSTRMRFFASRCVRPVRMRTTGALGGRATLMVAVPMPLDVQTVARGVGEGVRARVARRRPVEHAPVAFATPMVPWAGLLTIVSAILSPFGSEHASTTELALLAPVVARTLRQLGASCGPSTAIASLAAKAAKTRRPSPLTASPRGSSSARAARQSADAVVRRQPAGPAVGVRMLVSGIDLERHERVAARRARPTRRARRAGRSRRAARAAASRPGRPASRASRRSTRRAPARRSPDRAGTTRRRRRPQPSRAPCARRATRRPRRRARARRSPCSRSARCR